GSIIPLFTALGIRHNKSTIFAISQTYWTT
ncbi:hypothetical protein X975_09930, partial [Stegodyphus mimosarum]